MSKPHLDAVVLGDPIPWFRAKTLSGGSIDIHLYAGRWIILAFIEPLTDQHSQTRMTTLRQLASPSSDDQVIIYIILSTPPQNVESLLATSGPAVNYLTDDNGEIARLFGANRSPRTVILDPMLRAVANIPCEHPEQHDQVLAGFLANLPSVDDSAGIPLTAPVLMVPRVFDFPLCDHLVSIFEKIGGTDSGFLVERGGQPVIVTDHSKKSRRDLVIVAPKLRQLIRERIVKRLLPAIELYFQFRATHMDRYIVACYDCEDGGRFLRHRDNTTPGVEHRRFAVSLNLNSGYEGCDLVFPEFGRRTYRAPAGGALVFSCSALHEVRPITKGKRYAFLPFLYGESDVNKCLENDLLLQNIGLDYQPQQHSLRSG